MSRSRKGRRNCPSCAPGCKCDWCMSSVERRAERQEKIPEPEMPALRPGRVPREFDDA